MNVNNELDLKRAIFLLLGVIVWAIAMMVGLRWLHCRDSGGAMLTNGSLTCQRP